MPKPWKDPELQNRIRAWCRKNKDRVYSAHYEDITMETNVSMSTLYRYFPLIAGQVLGKMPSDIIAKRREHFGLSPWRRRLTEEEVAEIQDFYKKGYTSLDVAFATGRSLSQVEKYRPRKSKEEQ